MTLWDQITDVEREQLVLTIIGALPTSGVPMHLRGGLVRYFSDGILPGGFLQAVLCSDRAEAVARHSGGGAAWTIDVVSAFLLAHAPPTSWGSREAVLAWTTTPTRLEIGPMTDDETDDDPSSRSDDPPSSDVGDHASTTPVTPTPARTNDAHPERGNHLAKLFVHLIGHTTCVGYAVSLTDGHTLGITCLACGLTSFNPTDVTEKYCGHCHVFHEDTLYDRR